MPVFRRRLWQATRFSLLGVGGILAGLLLAEGAFRLAMVVRPDLQNMNPPYLVADPVTEHSLLPGITTRYISPQGEFDSRIVINSHGYHDVEFSIAKPPGVYRIVVVGDSLVEGLHLPALETFPKVLERRLNAARGGARRFEVINAGVSGMSPMLEYLALRDRHLALAPDLVVLCVFMNDVSEDVSFAPIVALDAEGRPLGLTGTTSTTAAVPPGLKRAFQRHSRLGVFVLNRYRFGGASGRRIYTDAPLVWVPGEPPSDTFAMLREPPTPAVEQAWARTLRVLHHTAALLAERRVRLVLAVIPAPNQVNDREWARGRAVWRLDLDTGTRPQAMLARFGAEHGVPVLDLIPALRASGQFPLYFPYDGHFTAAGHQVTAAAVEEFIAGLPWFPRP